MQVSHTLLPLVSSVSVMHAHSHSQQSSFTMKPSSVYETVEESVQRVTPVVRAKLSSLWFWQVGCGTI